MAMHTKKSPNGNRSPSRVQSFLIGRSHLHPLRTQGLQVPNPATYQGNSYLPAKCGKPPPKVSYDMDSAITGTGTGKELTGAAGVGAVSL